MASPQMGIHPRCGDCLILLFRFYVEYHLRFGLPAHKLAFTCWIFFLSLKVFSYLLHQKNTVIRLWFIIVSCTTSHTLRLWRKSLKMLITREFPSLLGKSRNLTEYILFCFCVCVCFFDNKKKALQSLIFLLCTSHF